MSAGKLSPRRLAVAVTMSVLLAVACEKGTRPYYQGISVATSYSYDLSGRTDRVKGYVYKIDEVDAFRKPGLTFLARNLNLNGEGYVMVNGHDYQLPAVPGDLLAKIIVPLEPAHLTDGINEVEFFLTPASDGFEVLDSRMESVEEKSAAAVGLTYRVAVRGRTASIDDFDLISDLEGMRVREQAKVPEWTERGKVRFYRAGINFDKPDRMFKMFDEANINLVMLRVPVDKQSDRYRQIKDFIDTCHDRGIRITASFSLGGIRLREALMNPALLDWVSLDEYGDRRWRRRGGTYLADLTNDEYRKEMMKVAEAAIDAEADELYYDWAIGGTGEVIRFFTDVRKLAAGKGRSVSIYGNCKGNILVDMVCDITKSESTAEAGVWDGKWVHNAAQSRFYYAVGDGWKPYRSKYEGANPGEPHPKAYDIRQGMKRGWKRPIAEANAFLSHFAIAETGSKLRDGWIFENDDLAMQIWGEICQYNAFLAENEELYTDVRVLSKIGVLAPPRVPSYEYTVRRTPIYDALAEMNLMYDVLLLPRINREKLSDYETLIVSDLPWVTEQQLNLIRNYKESGGKIFTIGSSEELKQLADYYLPPSTVGDIGNAKVRLVFLRQLRRLTGEPLISIGNAKYILANVVKKKDTDRIIMHFVNYAKAARNVRVRVDLDGRIDRIDRSKIRLFSPDDIPLDLRKVSVNNRKLEFTMPAIEIYNVVTID